MAQLTSVRKFHLSKFGLRLNKKIALACLLLLVLAVGIACFVFSQQSGLTIERIDSDAAEEETLDANETSEEESSTSLFVVHVDGAVLTPGVYRLEGEDLRLQDAVDAAGGLLDEADTTSVNLASLIEDGTKIYIPYEGEELDATTVSSTQSSTSTSDASSSSELININTATAEELDELPGVGPSTAAAIIQDREENGPFTSIEDIMRVSGIGEKKYAKMEAYICV